VRKEWLELLQTVCTAGHARAAFNGEANEGLEELRKAGLLEMEHPPSAHPKHFTPRYRPTEAGRSLCRKLGEKTRG
jgi:hypothetical protein